MKRTAILCCAIIAFLSSCTKWTGGAADDDTIVLAARCGGIDSRVMLADGLKTVWNKGDAISVFYGGTANTKATFKGENGSASGPVSFKCKTPSDKSAGVYASIPYSASNSISGKVLHCSIPAIQRYRAGSYDPDAALMVAASEDDNLIFSYACAVVCLEVMPNGTLPLIVESVSLTSAAGEKLAGDIAVDMQDPSKPQAAVEDKGSDSIEMRSSNNAPLCSIAPGNSEKFYFCVAPGMLSGGYRFSVRYTEKASSRTAVGLNSAATSLKAGTLSGIQLGVAPQEVIVIDFSSTVFSPVIPLQPAYSTTASQYSFDGGQYSIGLRPSEGSKYYLLDVNGSRCLRLDGARSSIKLPVIRNKSLKVFALMVLQGDDVSYKSISLSSSAVISGEEIPGDIAPKRRFLNGELTYAYVNAAPNSDIYLYTDTKNTQISRIEMYFE